ncbi:MAG: hypothetical protein KGM24_00745, partial [Elusimicrobia bacterium]|nr:hypothetical protein [Elusimicrobiota bacterium]
MGDPSRRAPGPRRLLAGFLAVLCALESGALPACAAVRASAAPVEAPAATSGGFDSLRRAVSAAGWAPSATLSAP